MKLRGKRVLVTGASRGIGEATARAFAAAGAKVALVARNADALAKVADEVGGTAHPADLSDPDTAARLVDEVGAIDVLVNNAGLDAVGEFAATDAAAIESIYRVNLLTPVQ